MRSTGKDVADRGDLAGLEDPRGLQSAVVLALMALYVVVFSAISIRQHDAFLTYKEDLGQIDQAVWNSLHGRLLVETDEDHQSTRLTDHVEPLLAASALVFVLWDDVRALLVLQAAVAALGAWAVYLLARDVLTGRRWSGWLAAAFALVYLLCPALEAAHLAEFHAAPLVSAPLAFALLFLERRQWGRFLVAALLVSAVKEEMALLGVMLGAAGLVVARHDRRSGIAHPAAVVLALSLVWFVLATFVIVPHFGASKYTSADSVYFQRFDELGGTPSAVVRTLLTNPALVARVLLTADRLGYLGGLLASTGFVALAAPEVLLLGAPLLAANVLSNFPAQYSGDFHYSAPLAPVLVAAAIYGTARLARGAAHIGLRVSGSAADLKRIAWPAFLAAVFLCVALYHHARGYSPLSEHFYYPPLTEHDLSFARFAAQVPAGARLSATPPLFPHLSHREVIYVFPNVGDADYLLLDAAGVTDMHPNDFRNAVDALLAGREYGVADSADGYVLLKRGAPVATLPDAFYDFARAPAAQPQFRTDVVFGDALRLVGYDVVAEPRWHRVRTRWYWQALRPLDADLRLYPFYHDASGHIIEDTTQRPLVATLWYPPSRWQVGETIVAETLPWDVGDVFTLAAGVMHGGDWERTGRRLTTATGQTQVELGTFAWQGQVVANLAR